jgi:hypothetical protein
MTSDAVQHIRSLRSLQGDAGCVERRCICSSCSQHTHKWLCAPLTWQVLAGQTRAMPGMRISGEVLYNGHGAEEFNVQRTCALVAQQDCHVPVLTVDETLEFASLCQVGAMGLMACASWRRSGPGFYEVAASCQVIQKQHVWASISVCQAQLCAMCC